MTLWERTTSNHKIMTKLTPKECQNVEYKKVWQDEYLKWICGFANAQGAVL